MDFVRAAMTEADLREERRLEDIRQAMRDVLAERRPSAAAEQAATKSRNEMARYEEERDRALRMRRKGINCAMPQRPW